MKSGTRRRRPTETQARWLRLIARSPLMKTYIPDDPAPHYSQNGMVVPLPTAEVLIRNGWVRGRRDGLWGDEQSYGPVDRVYEVLKPSTIRA